MTWHKNGYKSCHICNRYTRQGYTDFYPGTKYYSIDELPKLPTPSPVLALVSMHLYPKRLMKDRIR